METTPHQTPKDNKDDATREKMEKRVKNLFAEQDPPSYVSIREVDAMKARLQDMETLKERVSELESMLTQQAEDNSKVSPEPSVTDSSQPKVQLQHKEPAASLQIGEVRRGVLARITRLLDRLSYPRKFVVISLLFLLPLIAFYPLVNEQLQRIENYGRQELRGTDYLYALDHVLNDVQIFQIDITR